MATHAQAASAMTANPLMQAPLYEITRHAAPPPPPLPWSLRRLLAALCPGRRRRSPVTQAAVPAAQRRRGGPPEAVKVSIARAILEQAGELPLARRHELLSAAAEDPELAAVFAAGDEPVAQVKGLEDRLKKLAAAVMRSSPPAPPAAAAADPPPQPPVKGDADSKAADALTLTVLPEYEQYGTGGEEAVRAVISVKAVAEAVQRAQVALTCVLDRSGSMSGQRIELVQATCHFLIDQLTPEDYLGLCSYASDVCEDLPLLRMTPEARALAHLVVGALRPTGSTALYDGLEAGVRQQMVAEQQLKSRVVHSCFLFTDGQVTTGPSDPRDIVKRLQALQAPTKQHVTVHTFGFGQGHSVELLQTVAEAQSGVYYFIKCTDDIAGGFGDALGGLLAVVAKDVRLAVQPRHPAALATFRSGGRVVGAAGQTLPGPTGARPKSGKGDAPASGTVFNDMFAEESRECLLVLNLTIPAATKPTKRKQQEQQQQEQQQQDQATDVAQVDLEYTDVSSGLRVRRSMALRVARRDEPRPADQLPAELVFVTAARFETLDAIEEAQRAAQQGDGEDVSVAHSVLDAQLGRLQGAPIKAAQLEALSAQTHAARKSIMPRLKHNALEMASVAGTVQALKQQRIGTSTVAAPQYFSEYDKGCKAGFRAAATRKVKLSFKSPSDL